MTTFNEMQDPIPNSNRTFRFNGGSSDQTAAFDFDITHIRTIEASPATTITTIPHPVLIPHDQNIVEADEHAAPKPLTAALKPFTRTYPKKSRRSRKTGRYTSTKNVSFPILSPIGPIESLLPAANHCTKSNATDRILPQWHTATVPLGVEDDRLFLNGIESYLRSHLVEVFGADQESVEKFALASSSVRPSSSSSPSATTTKETPGRGPSSIGQIGIRCRYCHGSSSPSSPSSADDTAVIFPSKISEFYECAHRLFNVHFPTCPHVPPSVRDEVKILREKDEKGNLFGLQYWEDSARMLGMVNGGGKVYFGRDPNKGTLPKLRGVTAAYMAYMARVMSETGQETENTEGKGEESTTDGKVGQEGADEDVEKNDTKEDTGNTEANDSVSTTSGKETNENVENTDNREEIGKTEVIGELSTADDEETTEEVEKTDSKEETENTEVDGNGSTTACKAVQREKHVAGRLILKKIPAIPYIYAGGDTDHSTGNVPIGVTHVIVHDSVTHIDGCAFQNCKFLSSIHISDSVSSIGVRAFEGCSNLTSVRLPPGLRYIGHEAFSGCESLVEIRLPDGLARIEYRAFYHCKSLTTVSTVVDTDNVVMEDAMGFGGERCRHLPKDHVFDFTTQVASNVHAIGKDVFTKCTSLTKVTLPSGIATLGERAFFGCNALKSVRLPASIIGFPINTFDDCRVLDTIDGLGSSLTQWSDSTSTIHIIPNDDSDDDDSDDENSELTPQLHRALTAAGYSTLNLPNFLNPTTSSKPATHYYHTSIWYTWARLASSKDGRIPLMTAVAEPCSDWASVVNIFEKNMPGLYSVDGEVSGLSPFALAAVGKQGDLEVAFRLLREYPPAIMMMVEGNNDSDSCCIDAVVVDDDDVEDMDWDEAEL